MFGADPFQIEALAARQYRDRHLVHFRGRENELHMRWRLLEGLQQRVKGVFREHVDFVDNVDLVAGRDRRIAHRLDNLADIIDAGMAGGIHLDDVDKAAGRDAPARLAHAAGIDRGAALPVFANAVERLGYQTRGRCLADPAYAGHQEGMGQPVALDRIAQGLDHCVLADQFGKFRRPVFARQHPIGLRCTGCGLLRSVDPGRGEYIV